MTVLNISMLSFFILPAVYLQLVKKNVNYKVNEWKIKEVKDVKMGKDKWRRENIEKWKKNENETK